MDDKIAYAQRCEKYDRECQVYHKNVEQAREGMTKMTVRSIMMVVDALKQHLLVVPLAYAGSKPDAVMVEFHDTVVAQIAMGAPRGSENVAGLAELELKQQWRVRQIHLHVVHSVLVTNIQVLVRKVALDSLPAPSGYDSRLSCRRMKHKEVCHE